MFKICLTRHLPLTVEIKARETKSSDSSKVDEISVCDTFRPTWELSLDVVRLALISTVNGRWRVSPILNSLIPTNIGKVWELLRDIHPTSKLDEN